MSAQDAFKRAIAAHRDGSLDVAVGNYLAARSAEPRAANHNLGVIYCSLGRFDDAESAFRAALKAAPNAIRSKHSLGMLLLAAGRYEEGWPLYEARLRIPELNRAIDLPMPAWRGEDLGGKTILVVGEQGFGDQIMFARFVPQLEAMGAKVRLLLSPVVASLFSGTVTEPGKADYYIPIGSLPYRLCVMVDDLCGAAYLRFPMSNGGGMGVVTSGSPAHSNNAARSMGNADAATLRHLGRDLLPPDTGARTFRQTAEAIGGLDLIVTVDTAIAHLAGAMGKPVWILLPKRDTDWRWLRDRDDSPWYASARLFRQRQEGDWAEVLSRVSAALSSR